MNIAITGATGFVGKYAVEYFKQQGHSITAIGRNKSKLDKIFTSSIISKETDYSYESLLKVLKNNDVRTAKTDILNIELRIQRFFTQERRFPVDAAELGGLPDDPWGNPYVYLNIGIQNGVGKLRKDKNLVPINTDYDLYSKGPDGKSVTPLTANSSRDDIIRANNGAYVGEAEDY